MRFQRCLELNQPTLILTSMVTIDSALNITGKEQTGKDHENSQKSVFFSILMLKRREIEKFRITFNGLFGKIQKNVIFWKLVFPFDSMSEEILLEQKTVKNTKINHAIREKTLHELIWMFLQCFWVNM